MDLELDYKELVTVVDEARFENYENIVFSGISMLFFPTAHNELSVERKTHPIFYTPSSIANWDIYMSMNVIPLDFRRPCLAHEIAEIKISGLLVDIRDSNERTREAHRIAVDYDNRYAQDKMNNGRYEKYLGFRDELATVNEPGRLDQLLVD